MSDSNKIGSPPSNPSPDEDNVFANFDAGLAKIPPQPFSLYQNQQQQNQSDQGDDGSDQEKKDQIKAQQQKAAQLAEAQKETPEPSTAPSPTKTAPPVPGQPAPAQKTTLSPQQKQPSPFSLAGQTGKPAPKPSITQPQGSQMPQGQTPSPTAKGAPPAKPGGPLGEPSSTAQTAAQAKQAMTAQSEVASQTQAGAQQQSTVQSQQTAAQVVAGQVNQQMTAQGQASKAQTASTTSSISQRFTTAQTQTDETDDSYKSRQREAQKTDVQDNRLQQRFTGEQVADQLQTKTDTTPTPTTAPNGSTGASVAERVADVLKTQEDFINLVASVATNEKMTQVQLKDGTTINLNRTANGLDIAVTTPDTHVQQLLLSSKSTITSALSAKNIKVANLQVSLELQGPSNQPVEGTGRES